MKPFFPILLLCVFLSCSSFSQVPTAGLTGTVQDARRLPLQSITTTLLRATDSSAVAATLTDSKGVYTFLNAPQGRHLVLFTAVGYARQYSASFTIDEHTPRTNLPAVQLLPVSTDLQHVTVTARKPFLEQKIDRTVVNVDAAVTNTGATALEVLEKLPGVTVDKDGNISMKGKASVQVMIDGKPAYLSGPELVNLLRTMNANQLDQIELMTNPPAKYDASGNSGIINIKTKKNKLKGFNGSVTSGYGQGHYARTNNSLNLNYRTAKVNSFANLSFNDNTRSNNLSIERKYRNDDGQTINAIFDQQSVMKNANKSGNLKAGMDFFLSEKTTVGFVATGFLSAQHTTSANTSYLRNPAGITDSIVYSASKGSEPWKNATVNLNFRRQFDTTGRELTADLDYLLYSSRGDNLFSNTSYQPSWVKMTETSLKANLPININIYSAKADYTQKLKHATRLDAGVKTSYVTTVNAANYYNLAGADWKTDYNKTNNFNYTENINAAYISLNRQIGKIGIQAGLRYENTNSKGKQNGNQQRPDSSFSKSYHNLFPTAYISYAAGKKNQFGLNVGRRIDRPAYQDLNPFLFFLDNYTYQSGNPYLKPQFSTNVELSHTYNSLLTTTLNYSNTRNYFMETFEQSGYATVLRNGNIGLRRNAGVAVSAQVPVKKWLTTVAYANYSYSRFTGDLFGEKLHIQAGTLMLNLNNQFSFEHGWTAELSGFYRSRGVEGQILLHPMGQVSAGVSKQVLKGKGSLRLNVRDLFYTQQSEGRINFQRTEAHFKDLPDSRVANLTFSYRFGKPLKNARSNRQTGASSDEQGRIKTGGN